MARKRAESPVVYSWVSDHGRVFRWGTDPTVTPTMDNPREDDQVPQRICWRRVLSARAAGKIWPSCLTEKWGDHNSHDAFDGDHVINMQWLC